MKSLIGIAGAKRSGKDTLADILVAEYGYHKASYAQPLKDMALAIDPIVSVTSDEIGHDTERLSSVVKREGWELAKDHYSEVRRFLQRLGTDGVRNHLGEDTWVDLALPSAPLERTVFADVRFPNEADRILQCGGQLLRLVRPGLASDDVHSSETALAGFPMPVVVNDGSLRSLRCRAVRALS